MATYSIDQIVERILNKCSIGRLGTNKTTDYFVGATNNVNRRLAEHNVDSFIDGYSMNSKKAAQEVLKLMNKEGLDIGAEPGNGQDDSTHIYVYKKSLFSNEELITKTSLSFTSFCYDEDNYEKLPDTEGIYACFACTVNKDGDYHCERLMYIGMTEKQGFKARIDQHVTDDHKKWKRFYDPQKEHLVYVIAEDNTDILQTIESALIYKNQPLANDEYKDHYQGEYKKITVECNGNKGLLKGIITAVFEKK